MPFGKKRKKKVIKGSKDASEQRSYKRKKGALSIPGEKCPRQREQGVVCADIRVGVGWGAKRNPWK